MEQKETSSSVESMHNDSEREIELAVTSLIRVREPEFISRESFGVESEVVGVCPRLHVPSEYRVPRDAAHFTILDDVKIEVGREMYVLTAEEILVMNELFEASERLSARQIARLWCLPHEDHWKLYAWDPRYKHVKKILTELQDILGGDVLWKDIEGKTAYYQFDENLGIYDARSTATLVPSPVEPKPPKKLSSNEFEAGVRASKPPSGKGRSRSTFHQRVDGNEGSSVPYVGLSQVRREQLRRFLEGGNWSDAPAIAHMSGFPLRMVAAFIDHNRHLLGGKDFLDSKLLNKVVGRRETSLRTEHFSPKFVAWVINELARHEADYKARQKEE